MLQDDIGRLTTNRDAAQAGNEMINQCLETKLLDANTDKTVYIIMGDVKKVENIKTTIVSRPLNLGGTILKEKHHYKYLGDEIHKNGLSASISVTIKEREGRIISAIVEIKSILEDCRLESIGGSLAGLEIWELAIIPMLLNNCDTWLNITEETETILESLQELFCKSQYPVQNLLYCGKLAL